MKKEIEIEKWFRAKGTDTYFKTEEEAAEYARTEFAKELLQQIKLMYKNKKNCAKQIRQFRAMIEEAKSKTLDLREAWEIKEWNSSFSLLCSKKTDTTVKVFVEHTKLAQKDLHYLREIATYYCQAEIKKREVTIRACKRAIKTFSRDYENLRGGISKC